MLIEFLADMNLLILFTELAGFFAQALFEATLLPGFSSVIGARKLVATKGSMFAFSFTLKVYRKYGPR